MLGAPHCWSARREKRWWNPRNTGSLGGESLQPRSEENNGSRKRRTLRALSQARQTRNSCLPEPTFPSRLKGCTVSRQLLAHGTASNELEGFFHCASRSVTFFLCKLRVAARREFRRVECASLHLEHPHVLPVGFVGFRLWN
jgi:hypothetical protein